MIWDKEEKTQSNYSLPSSRVQTVSLIQLIESTSGLNVINMRSWQMANYATCTRPGVYQARTEDQGRSQGGGVLQHEELEDG